MHAKVRPATSHGLSGGITNCIIYNNAAMAGTNEMNYTVSAVYSCSPGLTNGTGNITSDPVFRAAGAGYGTAATLGKYALSDGSPSINHGTNQSWMANALDLAGNARILQGTVDMGAYEYHSPGSLFVIY